MTKINKLNPIIFSTVIGLSVCAAFLMSVQLTNASDWGGGSSPGCGNGYSTGDNNSSSSSSSKSSKSSKSSCSSRNGRTCTVTNACGERISGRYNCSGICSAVLSIFRDARNGTGCGAGPQPVVVAGACSVGQPFSLSISSPSYSNGSVYYDIRWGDSSAIQRVPVSGTTDPAEVHVVNHYYSSGNEYTAQVRATAANGAQSLWKQSTFTCSTPVCTPTTFCAGNNLWYRSNACVESLLKTCAYGCAGNACSTTPISVVDIQVGSALVRQGNTVTITWSAENVASCVVTEDNPDISDSWSCSGSACTWQTQTSSPIPSRTTYSLTCTGLDDQVYSDSVLVDVIPVFEEI